MSFSWRTLTFCPKQMMRVTLSILSRSFPLLTAFHQSQFPFKPRHTGVLPKIKNKLQGDCKTKWQFKEKTILVEALCISRVCGLVVCARLRHWGLESGLRWCSLSVVLCGSNSSYSESILPYGTPYQPSYKNE